MAGGCDRRTKMGLKDILNLIAIFIIPVVAVIVGQHLQNRAEIRKDKMHIFKVLMTSRIYGWTQEGVHCLNIIDIVFADDKKVRDAWKDLYDKYWVENPDGTQIEKIKKAQYKLLETMANSLGYKDKVTWETIQNPYIPKGMLQQINERNQSQQAYNNLLLNMQDMIPKNNRAEENNEH
jgi:hypothetical protein